MKRLSKICVIAVLVSAFPLISYSQIKWAQTGFNFLSVVSDARSAAMGEAVTSLPGFSGALFHNPATMAEISTLVSANLSVNSWIADIRYLTATAIVAPYEGKYGVIGLSLVSVDYGDLQGTMVWSNPDGFIDTEIFNPSAISLGIGYAKMISDQFGVGGQVRFAYQSLGKNVVQEGDRLRTKDNIANVVAFDFGTIYKTGIKSLAFGMSVRNFSKEIAYEQEGFQLPLLFTIGISANMFEFFDVGGPDQSLLLSLDATHPRSHPEQLKVGLEYAFMKIIALRLGYISNNSLDKFSYGFGVQSKGLGLSTMNFEVDYSYTPYGIFGNVQRITTRFSM